LQGAVVFAYSCFVNSSKGQIMPLSLKNYIQQTEQPLSESIVGKGIAIAQNRQHAAHKARLVSNLNLIHNDCRQAMLIDDPKKQMELLFEILDRFSVALKIFAEMSANNSNIGMTAVLDAESVRKELSLLNKK
jgi:hypothetical protein